MTTNKPYKTKKVKTNLYQPDEHTVLAYTPWEEGCDEGRYEPVGNVRKFDSHYSATPLCLEEDPRRMVQRKQFKTRKLACEWLLKVRDLAYWDERDAVLSEFGMDSDEFRQIDNP